MSAYTCNPCGASVLPAIPAGVCVKAKGQLVAIAFGLKATDPTFDSGVPATAITDLASWQTAITAGDLVIASYTDSTAKTGSETNVQGADANDSVGGNGYAVSKNNPTITGSFASRTKAQKNALFDLACGSQSVGLSAKMVVYFLYENDYVEAYEVTVDTVYKGIDVVRFDFEDPTNGDTRGEVDKSLFVLTLKAGYSRNTESVPLTFPVSDIVASIV
jgi:hypothetical protein